MNFWKRRGDEAATAQTMQLRDRERHPYAGLRSFTPQRGGELRLYQAVREAVPVVDAAVCKLIRLSGGALVFCEDPETEKRLRDFLERVPAGRGQYGINAFLEQYLESLLICGGAVGEMVPAAGNRDLAALLCGRMDRIELREGESPLDFQIFGPDERGRMAGAGANRGEDLHPALYAGAELELHGADERPAGGYAHHGNHCYSTDADAGGGADLPDAAADAGRDSGVPGGLGGYQLTG